jgi:hypothetical protein
LKICYIERRFNYDSQIVINQANKIINEYSAMSLTLTLRQLYYQFVSRDLIANTVQEYKKLGNTINAARLAGLIDWDSLEDRTRNLYKPSSWENPQSILRSAAYGYSVDMWENQRNYVEVWVEKEALSGVIADACDEHRVPYFSCRGYTSQSEQWAAGMRIARQIDHGKMVYILHLGDHDPSGIDMTRDNTERLKMFIGRTSDEENFILKRLALNMDQVEQYNPPENPAKSTDSRYYGYRQLFGDSSWELDALDPKYIKELINGEIIDLIDPDTWESDLERENEGRDWLLNLANK